MLIRLIDEQDIPACGRIYVKAFSGPPYREVWELEVSMEMLAGLLHRDPESCWCAEEAGEIVGFAFCTTYGTFRATIQEFAIAPEFQKKGFGNALMEHVLSEFRRRNIRIADLVVSQDAPAFRLYRKFGFRKPGKYVIMARWL
jgi:ribosomal protein S18 acetylase RimI-like enzyme